jgi:hypothetical protein
LSDLFFREVGVPLDQILHGIVQPFPLLVGLGLDHTAPENVAEQFVSGLVELGWSYGAFGEGLFLLGHDRPWRVGGGGNPRLFF